VKDPRAKETPVEELLDKLDGLRTALDQQHVKAMLSPMLAASFGEPVRVDDVRIEVLRSRSNRCLLRYDLAVSRPTHAGGRLGVIAKVLRPGVGERVLENMRDLWCNGFGRDAGDGIGIPEPLGFASSANLLLQEEVPGLPLKMVVQEDCRAEHFRQLARALSKLHACPIPPRPPFTVRDHLQRCHPKYPLLAEARPELARTIDQVVERAYRIEAGFGPIDWAAIHGDFHLGQLHIQNGHTWLVDFDALAYGDPAADLGNVLVFLHAKARRNPAMRALIDVFLADYFARADRAIARRIPLYEGLTHLRRACKAMRFGNEGWEKTATHLVEAAAATIDHMDRYDALARGH
jgi:hypothetical protein